MPTVSTNGFRSSEISWRRGAYDRYIAKTVMFPPFIMQQARRPIIIRNELLLRAFLPYTSTWKCYAGDHWFTGNRKVAGFCCPKRRIGAEPSITLVAALLRMNRFIIRY